MVKKASRSSAQRSRIPKTTGSKKTANVSSRLSDFSYNTKCTHCVDNSFRHSQIVNEEKNGYA